MTKHPLVDLEAEIREHIERETQDNIDRGMPPEAARTAALRRFGNVTLVREDTRAVWIPLVAEQLLQDVRYVLRTMRRQPGFSLGVIATLTVGLGLLAGGYTVFNGLFVRGWAVPDNSRLFVVQAERPDIRGRGYVRDGYSVAAYDYVRQHATAADFVAWSIESFRISPTAAGPPRGGTHLGGLLASDNFVDVLRIPLQRGTGFGGRPSGSTRVVISHGVWQRVFGSDPAIVGREVWVSGTPATVVGVTARDFEGLGPTRMDVIADMASPLAIRRYAAAEVSRGDGTRCCLQLSGRMREGFAGRRVREELTLLTKQYRTSTGQPPLAIRIGGTAPGDALRTSPNGQTLVLTFSLLGAAILAVLLLTCANVGNLYLARSLRRQREIATRLSLGASRARVIRQLLTEGLVMAAIAGACAFAMTAAVPPLLHLVEDNATRTMFASDWRVALLTLVAVTVTCLLVSLAPALQTTRIRWRGATPQMSAPTGRLRGILLAAQIAIATALVVSAALLTRGIVRATSVEADFALHTTTAVTLLPAATGRTFSVAYAEDLRARLTDALASSGLDAGVAGIVPVSTGARLRTSVRPAGSETEYRARFLPMTTAAARVLELKLVAGRWSSDHPRDAEALVNEQLAGDLWPGANPIGQTFTLGHDDTAYTVVGVTRDAHLVDLSAIEPVVHVPVYTTGLPVVLARTAPDLEPRIRAVVAAVDPQLSVSLAPLSERVKETLVNAKTGALIAATFGLVALLLSILGVFGVFSYLVEERRQEIGIRLALGASRRQIAAALLHNTRRAVTAGLVLGLALAVAAGVLLRGFLFGLSPLDPISYAAVAAILAVAALVATAVPVGRALRVDPAFTLRAD